MEHVKILPSSEITISITLKRYSRIAGMVYSHRCDIVTLRRNKDPLASTPLTGTYMEPLHRLRLSVGSRHIYFAFGVRGISSHLLRIWCPWDLVTSTSHLVSWPRADPVYRSRNDIQGLPPHVSRCDNGLISLANRSAGRVRLQLVF